jgi:putative O-methyltransferase
VKHPPYHLRPNKAVDRLTLIDAIRLITKPATLSKYTYYSMGGPTLDDFRLIYEFYPEIKMVCIERDEQTHRRQRFHLPCRSHRLKLVNEPVTSFLTHYDAKDEMSIFWLDYTDLEFSHFEDFMESLGKVGSNSIVKITLRSNPIDYKEEKEAEKFKKKFNAMLPDASAPLPSKVDAFATLVQKMLQIAAQTALPSAMPIMFLPVSSFYYIDAVGILTLTGIVCNRSDEGSIRKSFKKWQFANLNWDPPKEINVPNLSTKERLHLQRHLPCGGNAGRALRRALGYLVDENKDRTELQLQQYANFHRYFPYFIKAIP